MVEDTLRQPESSAVAADSDVPLETLYQQHSRALLGFLMGRLALSESDAQDIHQQVWIKVIEKRGQFRGASFRGWIFQIARNLLVDQHRRDRKVRSFGTDEDGAAWEPADRRDEDARVQEAIQERQIRLAACLERLKAEERHQTRFEIVRKRLEGDSYEHIVQVLSIPGEDPEARTRKAHKMWHEAKQLLIECLKRTAA